MAQNDLNLVIVVPVHNRQELTVQCLRSLGRVYRDTFSSHIIVVDDGSSDGTSEAIAAEFSEVQLIQGGGDLWYTGGTNTGMAAALLRRPDYILAINDDSIFDPNCLKAMIRCAQENPKTVVGALLCNWDLPTRVFQVAPSWDTWYGGWRHPKHLTRQNVPTRPFEVQGMVGNCVLYPAAAIREVGLMNARTFPHVYSDIEYTSRMRKKGWRLLIEPGAWVNCQPNLVVPQLRTLPLGNLLDTLFRDRRKSANLITLFMMNWKSAPSPILGALAFVIFCVRLILKTSHFGGSWPFWPDPKVGDV